MVAEIRRKSTGIERRPPTRSISRLSIARRSFDWIAAESVPISSRKSVPALGQLEAARPRSHGAREGALLVAEELRFGEGLRQRRDVDRDEGPVAAGAAGVDRAGHELLARPALALDQHGRVAGGDLLDLLRTSAGTAGLRPISCARPPCAAAGLAPQLPVLDDEAAALERPLEDDERARPGRRASGRSRTRRARSPRSAWARSPSPDIITTVASGSRRRAWRSRSSPSRTSLDGGRRRSKR